MNSFEGKCTAICPTICPPDQETCPGGTTGGTNTDGCPMPDTCLPKTFGTDGSTVCPAACPVPCAGDHLYCDGGFDVNGCKKPNTCVLKDGRIIFHKYKICNLLIDYVFLEGMCTTFCPTLCQADQETCPGGNDQTGCPLPDTCVSNTIGTDGTVCPLMCPVTCPEGQKLCIGEVDDNGCKMLDTCVANDGNDFIMI